MELERSAIIELFKSGKTHKEILKLLDFPINRLKFVYRTIQRYNETGGVVDRSRSGRPRSVTTPTLRKVIRERIRRNLRRSMRRMAKELKVSESSVRKVVKIDFGIRFKRKRIHFLTDKVQAKEARKVQGTTP